MRPANLKAHGCIKLIKPAADVRLDFGLPIKRGKYFPRFESYWSRPLKISIGVTLANCALSLWRWRRGVASRARSLVVMRDSEGLESLEKVMSKVKRPGDFCVHGAIEVPLPKVEIDGVGLLSFPVPPEQIARVIAQAERAPYGRGEETLLDDTVRKVWQLPPSKVRVSGKSWDASFAIILERVGAGLGRPAGSTSAEFYKMLVYDPGAFFTAHRDTEKASNMFGTLVVVLPSRHAGGDLLVRHAGRAVHIPLSVAEVTELGFAAFYADCEHEIQPVTTGHRVCLIFNLIQRPSRATGASWLKAPQYDAEITAATRALHDAFAETDAPRKIVWLLEHHYSPDGLAFSALKNADAARARVLTAAAEAADCVAHLGIVYNNLNSSRPQPRRRAHATALQNGRSAKRTRSQNYLAVGCQIYARPARR